MYIRYWLHGIINQGFLHAETLHCLIPRSLQLASLSFTYAVATCADRNEGFNSKDLVWENMADGQWTFETLPITLKVKICMCV